MAIYFIDDRDTRNGVMLKVWDFQPNVCGNGWALETVIMLGQGVRDTGAEPISAPPVIAIVGRAPFSGPDIFEFYGW